MENMVKNNNKKGFTIIEVVLVLAIAGLIFLMVFIALPALQRSQRNTQRQNDISRFVTSVNDFKVNNGNKTPFQVGCTSSCSTSDTAFVQKYIMGGNSSDTGKFSDPNGSAYTFRVRDVFKAATYKLGTSYSVETVDTAANGFGNSNRAKNQVDNIIYVYTYAACAGSEGQIVKRNSAGDYAFIYTMEGGATYCNGN
jgi:prepilin-type N-terminal cleavage/methylation domain-containing protein